MVSKDKIYVNDVSSDTIDLFIDTPPVPPMAKKRYTTYQTGADTDMMIDDGSFENIVLSFRAYQFFTENFDNRAVYQFLENAKTLKLSRLPDLYYKVRRVFVSAESSYDGQRILYKIDFECEPFKYAVSNDFEQVTNGGTVTNNGNRFSKPIIVIEGSGSIRMYVNSVDFVVNDISGTVAIDTQRQLAYTNSAIVNHLTSGTFPVLEAGENVIHWDGNITKMTVQKNERWY